MKHFLLLATCFMLVSSSYGQLVEIAVEPYVVHDGSIAELDGMTTYHVYAVCTSPADEISAVYGDATAPLSLTSTDGFYQDALGSNVGWTINPAFFPAFPSIEFDSWVTLGVMNQNEVTGQPNTVGMDVAFAEFAAGGDLVVNSENGGSWFTLFGDTQAQAGDDLKVLIAQLTAPSDAVITGNFNIQIFVNGAQSDSEQFEGIPFSSQEGAIFGCRDPEATNYNPDATESGETCIYPCALELAISEVTSNTCPGVADGELAVTAIGEQLGVLFGIDGDTPTLAVGVFDDLLGGTYTVTAVDGAGCEASIDVDVVAPEEAYAATDATVKGGVYLMEAGIRGASLPLYAFRLGRMLSALSSSEDLEADKAAALAYAENHFAEYQADVDRALAAKVWGMWMENVPADQQPSIFTEVRDSMGGDVTVLATEVYDNSIYASMEALKSWMETMDADALKADMGGKVASSFIMTYFGNQQGNAEVSEKMEKGYRLFTDGLRQAMPEKTFAPDANSTPRMTWGVVGSYDPQDAVHYDYITTLDGVMQKEDPSNDEFIVPARLKELYNAKDYGRYADENGDLVVNFISNNDITGGNSGSPVINGDGELIGTAFDGNWEAMSGDIFFEDQLQRCISVDIRYTLFIIDKYAGAGHLVDEMTVVQGKKKRKKRRK